MTNGFTPLNSISDWLSFLNERITSYESTQNTHLTSIEFILTIAIALIGINIAVKPANITTFYFIAGQWIVAYLLILVGVAAYFLWRAERNAPNLPYRRALWIRSQILPGALTDINVIHQQCVNSNILQS